VNERGNEGEGEGERHGGRRFIAKPEDLRGTATTALWLEFMTTQ
jgi:hypothetical protein